MYEALVARVRYHIQKANFMGLKEAESTLLLAETADAIEQLSNAGSAYGRGWTLGYDAGREESKPRWIPVEERLPEIDPEHHCSKDVIVHVECGAYMFSALEENIFGQARFECERMSPSGDDGYTVTHWMSLPEPPTAEEGE